MRVIEVVNMRSVPSSLVCVRVCTCVYVCVLLCEATYVPVCGSLLLLLSLLICLFLNEIKCPRA